MKPKQRHDWLDLVLDTGEALQARMEILGAAWPPAVRSPRKQHNRYSPGYNGRCKGRWVTWTARGEPVYRCICGCRNMTGKCERSKYEQ
jgi:hypothetical protein